MFSLHGHLGLGSYGTSTTSVTYYANNTIYVGHN